MCYPRRIETFRIADEEVEERIVKSCEDLKEKLLHKFRQGRAEHNDDLFTLNVDSEIDEELRDIHIYRIIKKLQEEKNASIL